MQKIKLLVIFLSMIIYTDAQQSKIDSLKNIINSTKEDTVKIFLYEDLGQSYRNEKKMDSSVLSYKQALEINEKNNYSRQKQCLDIAVIDYLLCTIGNYSESLSYATRQLALSESLKDTFRMGFSYAVFGHNYKALGEYRLSLNSYFKARQIFNLYFQVRKIPESDPYIIQCIGDVYLKMHLLDSALVFTQKSFFEAGLTEPDPDPGNKLYSTRILGDIYFEKGDDQKALSYYREYLPGFIRFNKPPFAKYKQYNRDLGFVFNSMAKIFEKRGQIDSAIFYAKQAFANAQEYQDQENLFTAATLLSNYYEGKDEHAAFSYLKIATQAKDSMISSDKIKQAQILSFNEQVREKENAEADAKEAARDRMIIIISTILVAIISSLIWYRIRQLRLKYKTILEQKEVEKLKAKYEKQLLELEASALRAQMNPHFIFNCLNSIKALMQEQKTEKGVMYLTIFSKLIRTLFNNADKKEISIYDEIETCKYYLQLEAMRFDTKFSYAVNIENNIDLKSIHVPALIIQPFIENAIWHGIIPRNSGGHISLNVVRKNGVIEIIIDDDGIGRETSQQNKSASGLAHKSRGVNLTQSRLELNNLLQQRQAKLKIIDKKDENDVATGTTVIIKIKEDA